MEALYNFTISVQIQNYNSKKKSRKDITIKISYTSIKRHLLPGRKAMTNLDRILKSSDITNKGPSSQGCGFSSGHVWM